MAPPTILAHKSAFLQAQTLRLSQGLAPSAGWWASWQADAAGEADEGGGHDRAEDDDDDDAAARARARARAPRLTAKAVDEAVYKLNHRLQQHVRRVYAPQATRNVAEQTDALFLGLATTRMNADAAAAAADDDDDDDAPEGRPPGMNGDEEEMRQGVDLALDSTIAALPPTWDLVRPAEATAHVAEAQRYAERQRALGALAARRAGARARLDRLRAMERLLRPFRDGARPDRDHDGDEEAEEGAAAGGGSGGVAALQRNLVTRNGEVEKELERMRVLLVRVAGRVAQLPDRPGAPAETVPDLDAVERDKVRHVLDSL